MNRVIKFAVWSVVALASRGWAQDMHSTPSEVMPFAPFEQWKAGVLSGDAAGMKALYSSDPAAQVQVNTSKQNADADVSFWIGLKARSMQVEFVRSIVRTERASVIFRADVATGLPNSRAIRSTNFS